MCVAVCARIVALNGDGATVRVLGVDTSVSVALIDRPAVGDHVLIHAGCAIQRVDAARADDNMRLIEELLRLEASHG